MEEPVVEQQSTSQVSLTMEVVTLSQKIIETSDNSLESVPTSTIEQIDEAPVPTVENSLAVSVTGSTGTLPAAPTNLQETISVENSQNTMSASIGGSTSNPTSRSK
jgi:hypothetical protein